MAPSHIFRSVWLPGLIALLAGACSFDDSRLEALRVAGTDAGGRTPDAVDDPVDPPDGIVQGDTDAGVEPDLGVDLRVDVDPACTDPSNACGGCDVLAQEPGDECAEAVCGVIACDGTEAVVCVANDTNACGGCSDLEAALGGSCGGSCGGVWVCEGEDALSCDGPAENACGGCGGPDGAVGALCGCEDALDEEHAWVCEGEDSEAQLSCVDGNDDPGASVELPPTSDDQASFISVFGGFPAGDTDDWYEVFVVDNASEDALLPDVSLVSPTRDIDLCAFWVYQTPHAVDIGCDSGFQVVSDDGVQGCCSNAGGLESELVRLRNDAWGADRLDVTGGAENDSGWLLIWVTTDDELALCDTYEMRYQL